MELTAGALLDVHWTGALLALISPTTVLLAITALGLLAWALKGATAAVEACCTAAVALVTGRETRAVVVVAGVVAVALTGMATLALGWHRPSDVLTAALVAVAVAATTRWTVAVCGRSRHRARPAQHSWSS